MSTDRATAVFPDSAAPSVVGELKWMALLGVTITLFAAALLWQDPQWFWQDDYQSYQLANYRDIARSWQAGEFPLLTPYSWQCGALAGEYQNGVFSIAITGLVLIAFALNLPLHFAAALISTVHLVVLATGTFQLTRRRGLAVEWAMAAALATTLSGWIMIWGARAWFPALAAFAWFPWFWWALERSMDGRHLVSGSIFTGIFLYLIVTAGWPFTVLMAGLLTAWLGVRTWVEQSLVRGVGPAFLGWCIGLGLSAPAWMMLIEYSATTVRGQTPPGHVSLHWTVPLSALYGLIVPTSTSEWYVFGTVKEHMNVEMAGGLVPLAALVAAFAALGRVALRKVGWELGLAAVVFTLCVLPSPGNFRWSFRWLPMFSLLLAVAGAHTLALCQERPSWLSKPGIWAAVLVAGVWLLAGGGLWATLLLGVCSVWAIADIAQVRWHNWAPAAVAVVGSGLAFADVPAYREVPGWPLDFASRTTGLDPAVRYLSLYDWDDIFDRDPDRPFPATGACDPGMWPGNYSLYEGIEFINGYSPMQPLTMGELFAIGPHGYLGPPAPDGKRQEKTVAEAAALIAAEAGPGDFLELMGVDGLVLSPRFFNMIPKLRARGWHDGGPFGNGVVMHRSSSNRTSVRAITAGVCVARWDTAVDLVRNRKALELGFVVLRPDPENPLSEATSEEAFAAAQIEPRSENRTRVVVGVHNPTPDRESMIVFVRPWFPGYRATFNGRPIPLELVNQVLPGVRLPAGESGELVLEYWPQSLQRGIGLVIIALMVCAGLALVGFVRKREEVAS